MSMSLRQLAVVVVVFALAPPASASASASDRAERCRVADARDAGPGRVLGVYAQRAACGEARRLVAAYQRCLGARCYTRIRRRCVQPEFLGRCRAHDRFFRRTLRGYRCAERRAGWIRGRYDGTVTCVRGRRRVDHSYTLFISRSVAVGTERELRAAWANPRLTAIRVTRDMVLRACRSGDPIRESSGPVSLDGGAHTLYARRGGIQVYDSIVSGNLVDGSGGGLGSTGDILVVRSHMDGNTTDGDGGAIYTDEDGDVTVIDSTVSGSTADGPGGAIFTLDGDVTIINSTLSGNRADDRGGAIAGEATVTVLNSTISRNLAVAHVGGGIWSRGNLYVGNSTISNNYAEAKGGGLHAAGILTLVSSTVIDNIASVAANIGVGERFVSFGSVIGPGKIDGNGGEAQPTETNCDAPQTTSLGYNVITDHSCGLAAAGDVVGASGLGPLRGNGGRHETRLPGAGSPAIDRIPPAACGRAPLDERLDGEQHLRGLIEARRAMLARDQRGLARPQGRGCDAGAVEVAR
jgi:hypothetical protein